MYDPPATGSQKAADKPPISTAKALFGMEKAMLRPFFAAIKQPERIEAAPN